MQIAIVKYSELGNNLSAELNNKVTFIKPESAKEINLLLKQQSELEKSIQQKLL